MPNIKTNTPVLAVSDVYQGSQEEREKQAAIADAREREMRRREIELNHDVLYSGTTGQGPSCMGVHEGVPP